MVRVLMTAAALFGVVFVAGCGEASVPAPAPAQSPAPVQQAPAQPAPNGKVHYEWEPQGGSSCSVTFG